MLQKLRMHTVDLSSDVVLGDLSKEINVNMKIVASRLTYLAVFDELRSQHSCTLAIVRVVGYISTLTANEQLVTLNAMLGE